LSEVRNYKIWIGGKWVEAKSGKTFTIVNPANGEEFACAPLGDKAEVDKAVEAAHQAFPVWSKKPQAERCAIMQKIAAPGLYAGGGFSLVQGVRISDMSVAAF
jgi:acyl-CoA reductase-like NAD-dependent aldehyde dehydrogenase